MSTTKTTHQVQLVKGNFTPLEATEILCALIDEKIDFHKVRSLQSWERDHNCDTQHLETRIEQLQEARIAVKQFIERARQEGANLTINGELTLSFTSPSEGVPNTLTLGA